jgi:hypothetical protein
MSNQMTESENNTQNNQKASTKSGASRRYVSICTCGTNGLFITEEQGSELALQLADIQVGQSRSLCHQDLDAKVSKQSSVDQDRVQDAIYSGGSQSDDHLNSLFDHYARVCREFARSLGISLPAECQPTSRRDCKVVGHEQCQ